MVWLLISMITCYLNPRVIKQLSRNINERFKFYTDVIRSWIYFLNIARWILFFCRFISCSLTLSMMIFTVFSVFLFFICWFQQCEQTVLMLVAFPVFKWHFHGLYMSILIDIWAKSPVIWITSPRWLVAYHEKGTGCKPGSKIVIHETESRNNPVIPVVSV